MKKRTSTKGSKKMSKPKLKKCPFCGMSASLIYTYSKTYRDGKLKEQKKEYSIECNGVTCNARIGPIQPFCINFVDLLTSTWNRRAT